MGQAFFGQQWHSDQLIGPTGSSAVGSGGCRNGRVGQRLKVGARRCIGEYQLAQPATVEAAVGLQHCRTETRDYVLQHRSARRHHLARQLIGVDDRHAQHCEQCTHSGFTAGDAPG